MASFTSKCLQSHPVLSWSVLPQNFFNCELSPLANISKSSDPMLQELALQLDFGSGLLQINDNHREILSQARKQLVTIPTTKKLYLASKKIVIDKETTQCTHKLSVQCKFKDAVSLESSSHLWNRLLLGFHPGQLSFILRASSDTLPTPMNLHHWRIQASSVCCLCKSPPAYNCAYFEWLSCCTSTRQIHLPT